MVYLSSRSDIFSTGGADGKLRIPSIPSETPNDTKTVVRSARDFSESDSELRTGMAKDSRAYRAPDAIFNNAAGRKGQKHSALLGHSELLTGSTP